MTTLLPSPLEVPVENPPQPRVLPQVEGLPVRDLSPIFYPKSIAVIGVTDAEGSVPFDIFHSLIRDRFRGPVYPVSPGLRSVACVKTYKYVLDIEDPVDLAVLVFPSSVCHLALEQCGQKGVRGAIVISAGFREAGPAGVAREAKLQEIAARYGIALIGPNCLGVINTDPLSHLNASFARQMPAEGEIAFLSQSGALCTAVLDYAQDKGIGFSKFVSFGNKADVSEVDLIYYLADDPKTKVILLYLEEVSDGRALMEAARSVMRRSGKPILVIKSGRTEGGAAAAASHTGSLAGSDEVCDAAFRQAGMIRCSSLEEMFDNALAITGQPLPGGRNVAIVTNAGGPGVLAADEALSRNLNLAQLGEDTKQEMKKQLSPTASLRNPVDIIGDARADRYRAAVAGALGDPGVDGVCVILTPQSMTPIEEIAEDVSRLARDSDKPLYTSFMGGTQVAEGIRMLRHEGVPHFAQPEAMIRAFEAACRVRELADRIDDAPPLLDRIDRAAAEKILNEAGRSGRKHMSAGDALEVLEAYGLPVLPGAVITSEDEAVELAACVGYPVVLKAVSDEIVHKIDVGGVILGLSDEAALRQGYRTLIGNVARACPDVVLQGVLVEKMAPAGEEVILGLKQDPSFGPVLMFGLGGTAVEVFKDVSFRVAPVGPREISSMIRQVQAYRLLSGFRGRPEADISALEECLLRLSRLAVDLPQIRELDINPLVVGPIGAGCAVADARIIL